MLDVFRAVMEELGELEQLRIAAQVDEIMYRQKGEFHTANRLKSLEESLTKVICLLKDGTKQGVS